MVLASKRSPGAGLYIVQDICKSPERFNLNLLQRAWREMARRHAILRSGIETRSGGALWQQPLEDADIVWREIDWTSAASAAAPAAAPEDIAAHLTAFLREDRERGFDLDTEVASRFTLLRTPSGSTLVWTAHHVLLDGRSYVLAWRELLALYEALGQGSSAALPHPEPFSKHVAWVERQDMGRAEQYWRDRFGGLRHTTEYVVDRLRSRIAAQPYVAAKESVSLSEEFTAAVSAFARQHSITISTLVQGAWALLLGRYSGRSDVVFGLTRAGRHSVPRANEIIGVLINTTPFRVIVDGSASVLSFLQQIRQQSIAAREFEHTPIEKVWEWAGLPPGMPPFDSVLVFEHERPAETFQKLGGAWRNRVITRAQRTDSPLTLAAYGSPLLTLDIIYDASLFTTTTIAALAGHLQMLLVSFIAQPENRVSKINMLTAAEREWLIGGRNSATVAPQELCAHQLFEQQALRTPNAIALDGPGGPISYDRLNQRANQLARHLRERGAGPEDFVAVCLDPSPDAVTAALAILKAGAAFLPLHPGLPPARLRAMLNDACPALVITEGRHLSFLGACKQPVLRLDQLSLSDQPKHNLPSLSAAGNAAYAIYTSGSTGLPKAVVISHRSLVNHTLAAARAYDISESDRRLQFATLAADMFVAEVFNYLCHGATLVSGLHDQVVSVREFLRLLETHRITITGIPSTWWKEWAGAALPACLRAVIVGMERVDAAAVLAWKRSAGQRVRLFNAYGPTETSPTTTIYEVGSSPWDLESFVPIGKPLANTYAYILDAAMNPAPMGVPGELYIGGAGVARGYLNAPELTARGFLDDPFRPGNRLFRTGDLAFALPDGNLVFLGRADRQVKIRGFRVELDEIEAALARHPAIRQCAVVLQEGDPRPALVAYVAFAGSSRPVPNELRQHLARYLPDHMVPAAFVVLPQLPLTASGKIDRHSLPRSDHEPFDPASVSDPPSTPTEKRLARIWQQVLPRGPLRTTQNFFEAGGDSLCAAQLLMRISEEFGSELPYAALVRAPTLAQIARVIDESEVESEAEHARVLHVNPGGGLLPLICISSCGEDLYVFRHIAAHLDAQQPMVALTAPVTGRESVQTVEELAGTVCRDVRALRPHGPYLLGGYCFGGLLAFEAAQQLIAAGERVELVALIDTPAPGYPKIVNSRARYWLQVRQVLAGAFSFRDLVKHAGVIGRLLGRRAAARTQRAIVQTGLSQFVSGPRDNARLIEMSARMYVPRPLASDVALLMAGDDVISTRVLEDPRLGWRDLSRNFEVHRVQGTHGTLLAAPHAPAVADILTELLRRYYRA